VCWARERATWLTLVAGRRRGSGNGSVVALVDGERRRRWRRARLLGW
jgi:hypothetical protein